jgi:hypothetical protein
MRGEMTIRRVNNRRCAPVRLISLGAVSFLLLLAGCGKAAVRAPSGFDVVLPKGQKTVENTDFSYDDDFDYDVIERTFVWDDVSIKYPWVYLWEERRADDYESGEAETKINNRIRDIMFCGETVEYITSYPGVIMMDNSYAVTYADDSILSMCIHIDAASGGSRGAEYWTGLTFDLRTGEELTFADTGIPFEEIRSAVRDGEPAVIGLFDITDTDVLTQELDAFDVTESDNYYLADGRVGITVRPHILSRTENAVIEVAYDWTRRR